MNLRQHKTLLMIIVSIIALIFASPFLQHILVYPQNEFFTELSLLGPAHTAENYPYNITRNVDYTIYLEITNHLGSSANYEVHVKFRNETQSAPDAFNKSFGALPSLYTVNKIVADNEGWELPVTFSLDYSSNAAKVSFKSLMLNGQLLSLSGLTSDYNSTRQIYYGNLIFELWIYNSTSSSFQYHERYVDLKFNMATI